MSSRQVFIPGSGGKSGTYVSVPNAGGFTFVPGSGTNPGQYVNFAAKGKGPTYIPGQNGQPGHYVFQ
jgi:hypothetical protein